MAKLLTVLVSDDAARFTYVDKGDALFDRDHDYIGEIVRVETVGKKKTQDENLIVIEKAELVKVLGTILKTHYVPTLVQMVSEKAEQQVVKQVMSDPMQEYIHGIVDRGVMEAVGRLIASRIQVNISLLKLEGQD